MQTVTFNTNGRGYWSEVAKAVRIVDMQVNYCDEEKSFGELCVYFNTEDWNVNTDGLIYTDALFKEQLVRFLNEQGLAGDDVSYSEQGMQGDDYVSCDIGEDFIASWEAKFNTVLA